MSMSRKHFLRGMAVAACMISALPAFATAADAAPGMAASPILQCRASFGATAVEWTVELDDTIPLAIVDSADTPAEYSNGHVSVRLAASGPNLFIGLASGRLLVTAVDGQALAKGNCKPLMSVATEKVVPIATFAGPAKPFHLTRAWPARTLVAA